MRQVIRVTICDDDASRVQTWKDRVQRVLPQSGFEVTALPPVDFGNAVKALHERLTAAKAGDLTPKQDGADIFDTTDILVLDSDLTPDASADPGNDPTNVVGTYLAGEIGSEVARLARTYTKVGAIAVVNQGTKSRTFDLSMMRTAKEPADVYVTEEDLDNPRLWRVSEEKSYRPWSWPILAQLPTLMEKVVAVCTLDTTIFDCIGLENETAEAHFSSRQCEALSSDVDDISCLTLRDIARKSDYGLGLRPKEITSDELLIRVGVWGLRRWLERVVVPSQNVLVDFPHMLQSNPWLVNDRAELDSWNNANVWWYPTDPGIAPAAFNRAASMLLGRNVWDVHQLPQRPKNARIWPDDPVFCEDTSDFREISTTSDFPSDIEGPYGTRFIAHLPDIDYVPRPRLFK